MASFVPRPVTAVTPASSVDAGRQRLSHTSAVAAANGTWGGQGTVNVSQLCVAVIAARGGV